MGVISIGNGPAVIVEQGSIAVGPSEIVYPAVTLDWDRVFNPPATTNNTYSNGDRTMSASTPSHGAMSNLGIGAGPSPGTDDPPASRSSGKWYCEVTFSNSSPVNFGGNPNQCFTGITDNTVGNDSHQPGLSGTVNSVGYRSTTGACNSKGVSQFTGSVIGQVATLGMAVDLDNLTLDYYLDGVFEGQATIPAAGAYVPYCAVATSNVTINGGTVAFNESVPSGFTAWNTGSA